MSSLRELQRGFMRAILDEPVSAAALPVVDNGIAAAERLAVYAGNARGNFQSALESSYPVIRRLVGADYFEQCARAFQHEHPSRGGDLQPAGERFPAYLDLLHGDSQYRYLGDVARFEWLLEEACLAADHAPLDLSKLAAVAQEDYEGLRFRLHPSARLFESPYPCLAIWRANTAADEPPMIDLHGAPRERIAIVYSDRDLRFHALSAGEHSFLAALQAGTPFAAAIAAAAEPDTFDAGAALQRFVLARAIVDFH